MTERKINPTQIVTSRTGAAYVVDPHGSLRRIAEVGYSQISGDAEAVKLYNRRGRMSARQTRKIKKLVARYNKALQAANHDTQEETRAEETATGEEIEAGS